jgi:hypothetical protein
VTDPSLGTILVVFVIALAAPIIVSLALALRVLTKGSAAS